MLNSYVCFNNYFIDRHANVLPMYHLVWNQIQSTKNIQKITSSMKMVSAAKLKGDETRRATSIAFNTWAEALNGPPKMMDEATFEELPNKVLLVPITSDKGLCGGVNSFITRGAKAAIAKLHAQGKTCDVAVIGDKGRGQLRRFHGDLIKMSVTEMQAPGNFTLAAAVASELIAAGAHDYDAVVIIYNAYQNAATYYQMYKTITPFSGEGEDEPLLAYEFEPDTKSEVLADLHEYLLTSQIYHSLMDGAAAEQSSRMQAMENASKNAGEMIDSLTLQYNRARQARITTELIEIISGASALEG
jgi:F-type H+-transporting ATPase subunit gamma